MTNDYRAGKMSIQKCDKCRDGYLIVKQGTDNGFLLGCTNYKPNGTGCNKTINKKYFYEQMKYDMEEPTAATEVKNMKEQPSVVMQGALASIDKKSVISNELKDDYIEIIRADVASVMYGKYNLNDLIFTIVKALQNVSRIRFYGVTMLTDVLNGVDNKKIFDNKLDKIPEFGALKDLPHETIQAIIEWMISEHFILKTKGRYPVLHSTYEGLHYSEVITEKKLKKLKKYLEEEVVLWN